MKKLFIFSFMFVFVMMFSTCFGANITMSELGNLIEKKYDIDFDESYSNSTLTNILNSNPLIISTWDNKKLYFFPTNGTLSSNNKLNSHMSNSCKMTIGNIGSSANPTFIIGYSKSNTYSNNFYYNTSGGTVNLYLAIYDIENGTWTYNDNEAYRYYGSQAGNGSEYFYNYGARSGTSSYPLIKYSNVSSSVTLDDFTSVNYLRKFLSNNILFNGCGSIYYNEFDLTEKWNGVWDGTGSDSYGGYFQFSGQYLYYYYESGLEEPIDLVIEMNTYYPASLSNLSKTQVPSNNGDKYDLIYAGTEWRI